MGIKALTGIFVALVALLAIAWWQGWITPDNADDSSMQTNNGSAPPENGIVKRVIDPITVELESGHIIRYIGVRTPSVIDEVECFGKEALLANESIIGKQVRLEEEPLLARSNDGAWTRYVFFPDETASEMPPSEPAEEEQAEEPANEEIAPDLADLADQISNALPEGEDAATATPTSEPTEVPMPTPKEIFVNERILEGGFGFPVVSEDMVYGERLLSAARFASATGKGLWGSCEIDQEAQPLRTQKLDTCVIKGKVTGTGEKLYRTPECPAYKQTIPVQSEGGAWFCAEDIAQDAGFAKASDCP